MMSSEVNGHYGQEDDSAPLTRVSTATLRFGNQSTSVPPLDSTLKRSSFSRSR
jgi:hypothetical protein